MARARPTAPDAWLYPSSLASVLGQTAVAELSMTKGRSSRDAHYEKLAAQPDSMEALAWLRVNEVSGAPSAVAAAVEPLSPPNKPWLSFRNSIASGGSGYWPSILIRRVGLNSRTLINCLWNCLTMQPREATSSLGKPPWLADRGGRYAG